MISFIVIILSDSSTNYKLGSDGNIRVYLINLDRRHERLSNCDKQLKYHGLNYTRFKAFDAHDIKRRDWDKIQPLHSQFQFDLHKYLGDHSNCQESCGPLGKCQKHII